MYWVDGWLDGHTDLKSKKRHRMFFIWFWSEIWSSYFISFLHYLLFFHLHFSLFLQLCWTLTIECSSREWDVCVDEGLLERVQETQPLIYMTGAVNGSLICMLMYVRHHPAKIFKTVSKKRKILQRKCLMQVKMCLKYSTQSSYTNLL